MSYNNKHLITYAKNTKYAHCLTSSSIFCKGLQMPHYELQHVLLVLQTTGFERLYGINDGVV